jgi:hypothetical protein
LAAFVVTSDFLYLLHSAMASPVGFTKERPSGLKRSVDYFYVGNKKKRLVGAKGFTRNEVTMIGDSIIQFLTDLLYTSIQSIPGTYARHLVNMCISGRLDISNFKCVVIFCGTNDLTDSSNAQIMASMSRIIAYIRQQNHDARIAICGVLPRPCDGMNPRYHHLIQQRIDLNEALKYHCMSLNVQYFKVDKAIKGKGSDALLYHTDFLHLSDVGLGYLKLWLDGRIGCLLGSPPQI